MPQAGSYRAVVLVGFMGAGKTSVGRSLAQRLGWVFTDLDDRIETRAQRSIAELFRDLGESGFRRFESAALHDLIAELNSGSFVVALGGGAFSSPENRALIEGARALVVFLDGPAQELFRRCEQERRDRPLLQDAKRFQELYEQRRSSYRKAAHSVDTAGKDVDAIAMEVACRLGSE